MARFGCGTGVSGVHLRMEFHQQLGESLCRMLLGDYLLESSWNLAFQTMQLQIELQPVDILCRGIASVFMGKSSRQGITNQFFVM